MTTCNITHTPLGRVVSAVCISKYTQLPAWQAEETGTHLGKVTTEKPQRKTRGIYIQEFSSFQHLHKHTSSSYAVYMVRSERSLFQR